MKSGDDGMARRKTELKDSINENLRAGYLELLILQILSEKDCYGYEMKNEITERTNGVFTFSTSSLYIPLLRLTDRGYISSRKEIVVGKRFRTYYHIEKTGIEYLEYGKEQFITVVDGIKNMLY